MVTIVVFLALIGAILSICLILLLTNQPKPSATVSVTKEAFAEQDPGQVPSVLVREITLSLLGTSSASSVGSSPGSPVGSTTVGFVPATEHSIPPTVRLERAWQWRDGRVAWQVFVCHFNRCDIDFGSKCERVRIEYNPLQRDWNIVKREPADLPGTIQRPSSDALLLPGYSA